MYELVRCLELVSLTWYRWTRLWHMVLIPDLPCVLVRPNTASEDNCHPWTFGKLMVSPWSVEADNHLPS